MTFPPIPRFSPEVFATARPLDTGKTKQFRKGLEQLDEEGVVQVLRDADFGDSSPILAAVGALQFDVFGHRLASEFNAPAEILTAGYQAIRRTDKASARACARSAASASSTAPTASWWRCSRTATGCSASKHDEPELTLEPLVAGAIPTP